MNSALCFKIIWWVIARSMSPDKDITIISGEDNANRNRERTIQRLSDKSKVNTALPALKGMRPLQQLMTMIITPLNEAVPSYWTANDT